MADQRFHDRAGPFSLEDLARIAGAELADKASSSLMIEDVAPLDASGPTDVSFLDNARYRDAFRATEAGACIVSPEMAGDAPAGLALLLSSTPYRSYALVAQAFYPESLPEAGISERACVHPSAKIGEACVIEDGAVIGEGVEIGSKSWIEANAVIGRHVVIGPQCRIGPGASVSHAVLGTAVRLYPGVRVGQDGFGFAIDPAGHVKVPQLGRVIIGDHVEIGANTCIDRGAGPDTVIGDGTWIDNLVQIAHNVRIGKGCVIVAQSGIAGSTEIGDYCVIAAQAGVAGHLSVGKGSRIGAQSGVMRDIPAGSEVLGAPAQPVKQFMRQVAALKRLTKPPKNA